MEWLSLLAAASTESKILRTDFRIALADDAVVSVTGRRISYSADNAHLFDQIEYASSGVDGATELAPGLEQGWRTYNFEVEDVHTYIANGWLDRTVPHFPVGAPLRGARMEPA